MNGARLILTATDRLARELREQANLQDSRSGAAVWEAPRITSLSRWIIDTWTAGWPEAQLLSAAQELVLWQDAVERDEAGRSLLAPLAAAREARRADQLLRRYRIDAQTLPAWQDEHHAFRRWRAQVQARLRQNQWLTPGDIAGQVVRALQQAHVVPPEHIELVGFVEPPVPSEQAVLDALSARGTQIEIVVPAPLASRVEQMLFDDDDALFRFVAQDIRERLRAFADHPRAPPRIVIALPDADARREKLDAVLRDLLAPWAARGEGPLPWRWERGRRLSEQPQVETLLAILQLRAADNAPALISRVLLSAALWTPEELAHSARADYLLREAAIPRIALSRVIEVLPAALAPRVAELMAVLKQAPSRALPSAWAEQFRRRLDALGWPGSEALDSQAYQAVRAARAVLDRLGTLDTQLESVPQVTAREWLSELARGTFFAPRVEHAQPVLITSLDEACALRCERLYVLDVSAARMPLAARPTPFVPLDAQRAAGIAEALPELWLARAQRQTQHLMNTCADEVLIGVARVDERGAELEPSALFGASGRWQQRAPQAHISAVETFLHQAPERLMHPQADVVPPVDAAEQSGLHADSALFKAWFESPFFALCRYRLGIRALPEPARGLDARVQGTLVHSVLEGFWNQVRDSVALARMDTSALRARVEQILDAQLPQLLPTNAFGAATVQLERARAMDVIVQWLLHEQRRVDAFRVMSTETRAEPMVAGLQLRLRLDRVDQVASPCGERWLVMDYKTGREADTRGWKSERLLQPQLPLYASHAVALAADIPAVHGICFAHVKDGHPALVAQTAWRKKLIETSASEMSQEWEQRLVEWRAAIERAAGGFLAGEAWVDARVTERSTYADLLALTAKTPDEDVE